MCTPFREVALGNGLSDASVRERFFQPRSDMRRCVFPAGCSRARRPMPSRSRRIAPTRMWLEAAQHVRCKETLTKFGLRFLLASFAFFSFSCQALLILLLPLAFCFLLPRGITLTFFTLLFLKLSPSSTFTASESCHRMRQLLRLKFEGDIEDGGRVPALGFFRTARRQSPRIFHILNYSK